VVVKGGDGKEKAGSVQVLPPTVNTFSLEIGGGKEGESSTLESLNHWMDKLGGDGAKFEVKVGGALELFWGWKEQIEDYGEESQIWRAAYTTECQIGMKPLIGAKVELTVSALQIAFGMPQCLTKHIGDL